MENQEKLMEKLSDFLEIFKGFTGNFDIVDFKTMLDLACGCRKPVYVIMIELGFQVKYAASPLELGFNVKYAAIPFCDDHDWEHQFSYDWSVKHLCKDFFDFNLKNRNSPYHFTLQPRK